MRKIYMLELVIVITFLLSSISLAQNNNLLGHAPKAIKQSSGLNPASLEGRQLDNRHVAKELRIKNKKYSKSGSKLTKVYCYVAYDPTSKLAEGPAFTFLEKPDSIISLANQSTENFISGGTWCNDNKWYGTVYTDNTLITIDISTGARTVIGTLSVEMTDIAFDNTTNTLWGISYDGTTNSSLYTIDMHTGNATLIGISIAGLLINLACDISGNLYSLNTLDSVLYSINKNSGAAKAIGSVGFKAEYAQSMEFESKTNTCYMAAYNIGNNSGELRTCDVTTGKTTLIGAFQDGAEITGFAIPNLYNKNYDVAAVSIDEKAVLPPNTFRPKATIFNNGLPSTFNVTMKVSTGTDTVYSSTKSVLSLGTFDDTTVVFDPWSPAPGNYTFTFYTQEAGDMNLSNDTLRQALSVQNLIKAYCYVAYDPTGNLPEGPAITYLQRPDSIVSLANQSTLDFVDGGTWCDDNKWYGSVYDSTLVTINILTGQRTVIGKMKLNMNDITFDNKTKTLWGISYNTSTKNSSLYKIDRGNANTTFIGISAVGLLIDLACDSSGNLYSLNTTDTILYSINKSNGAGSAIGKAGFPAGYAQGMEFDILTNICYMSAFNTGDNSGELRICDVSTGATTLIGAFQDGAEISGFTIPNLYNMINDVASISINEPNVIQPQLLSPKATFINNGLPATFNVTMKVSTGTDTVYSSIKSISNLSSFTETQVVFDPWSPTLGNYKITIYTSLSGDINRANDTLRQALSVQNYIKAYCYVAYDPTGKLPAGPAYTYLQNPDSIVSIANQTTLHFAEGGTWCEDNKWYCSLYLDSTLVTIDVSNGARTVIGKMSGVMLGITFDPKSNTLWGISYDGTANSSLYKIDRTNAKSILIGKSIAGVLINLACDTLGNLYSLNISDSKLYSINKTTGAATVIGSVGFTAQYAQSMGFDRQTNICYMSAYNSVTSNGELRTCNISTGATTLIGTFHGGAEITGFAIPYLYNNVNEYTSNKEQLEIYPNPARRTINVYCSDNIKNIKMLNSLGQIISNNALYGQYSLSVSHSYVLNTSSVASGIYLLQIETTKGITSKKVIIYK